MQGRSSTAVEEARAGIRERAQATVGEAGALAQETSGGSEVRDMVMRAARQTAGLDAFIRDTQQSLAASQAAAVRLAARVDGASEQWKSLSKTIDIVRVACADL
ncbi:hypothetical protein H4R18_004424 [Coemansia javaensis]|uniref:BLOC-1-related complex subunit 7 n=1 Tax=Coemansia javaensis TaxID=2761396 RepID=A0A9W8LFT9_9FUNG|nr:hypothetical protein H4R18_004424 [Coemansia javaensis]